jgi:UPF0716 protein FxsA
MEGMLYLILLLVLVPVLELVLLLQVHHAIASAWGSGTGLLVTLGTIVLTGVVGAVLARHQGMGVLRELRRRLRDGELPGRELLDGVLILIGAALLLTPGFLTDLLGFSLLVPWTRAGYRHVLRRWLRRFARSQAGAWERGRTTIVTTEYRTTEAEHRLGKPK